ncbi:FecR family protein [Spirosoma fluviale]|nr:FecR family protein [Spirosoma fluviale]
MKKIIFDYFNGNNTTIQCKLIEEWLAEPKNIDLFYVYLDEWEAQHPQYRFDLDTGLKKVYTHINTPAEKRPVVSDEPSVISLYPYLKWAAAASILLVAGWLSWSVVNKPSAVSYKSLVRYTKNQTGEIYEKENVTNQPLLINLPDNSSIILQPHSKICYSPKQYNRTKREVILAGEAFFEVQKDAKRPFFVYANELITKVLGTSFSVKTQPETSEIEVIVKTGRVSVFLQHDRNRNKKMTDNLLEGLVLTANEKVRVSEDDFRIYAPTVVEQKSLQLPIQKIAFDFDETPLIEVLNDLQKAYSIQLVYNPEKLADCKLTAHLSDEPLLEKLKLICAAIDATYEEVNDKLIIHTNGCK